MERIEEAEGERDPIGRPSVSTNVDPRELPETEPPTRQHTKVAQGTQYIYEDCLVWLQWEKMHLILERLETQRRGNPGRAPSWRPWEGGMG